MFASKDFAHLIGTPGFSETLLTNHFTLYQGYVTNTNKLVDLLKTTEAGSPQYAELKRRFGWEWNGMRLHELYFGNISKDGGNLADQSALAEKIERQFGSLEDWEKDFRATGALRGIGWAILYHDLMSDRLFNCWVNEHDMGHLAGCTPLLIMDVFEHAFMLDYGVKRADYIAAFMYAVDWNVTADRLLTIRT